jgi:hypothetical protein
MIVNHDSAVVDDLMFIEDQGHHEAARCLGGVCAPSEPRRRMQRGPAVVIFDSIPATDPSVWSRR